MGNNVYLAVRMSSFGFITTAMNNFPIMDTKAQNLNSTGTMVINMVKSENQCFIAYYIQTTVYK